MNCLLQAYYKQQVKIRLIRGDMAKEKNRNRKLELKIFLTNQYRVTDNLLKEMGFEYFFLNCDARYLDKYN